MNNLPRFLQPAARSITPRAELLTRTSARRGLRGALYARPAGWPAAPDALYVYQHDTLDGSQILSPSLSVADVAHSHEQSR